MNDTHLFQLTLTAGNGKIHDQVAYSVNLIRWRIALQCVHAEFCQSGSLAFHKYDFQGFLQGASSGFQQFSFSYSQSRSGHSIDTRSTLDRLSIESRPSVDRVSIDCGQTVDHHSIDSQSTCTSADIAFQVTDTSPTLGRHLADTWPTLRRYLADTWPILDRHLADTPPILDRYLTDTTDNQPNHYWRSRDLKHISLRT